MKPITCKEYGIHLYRTGGYGNCLRQWDTLAALDSDGFEYPIVMRYAHPQGGGGPCVYHIHRHQVQSILEQWRRNGWNLDYVYYNEGAPDEYACLQGELLQHDDGSFTLFYNTVAMHMRDALAHPNAREIHGRLSILDLIQRHMSPSSYSDFESLIELYPEHVIEFTTFNCLVGCLKGRNTIFWEVRQY